MLEKGAGESLKGTPSQVGGSPSREKALVLSKLYHGLYRYMSQHSRNEIPLSPSYVLWLLPYSLSKDTFLTCVCPLGALVPSSLSELLLSGGDKACVEWFSE